MIGKTFRLKRERLSIVMNVEMNNVFKIRHLLIFKEELK